MVNSLIKKFMKGCFFTILFIIVLFVFAGILVLLIISLSGVDYIFNNGQVSVRNRCANNSGLLAPFINYLFCNVADNTYFTSLCRVMITVSHLFEGLLMTVLVILLLIVFVLAIVFTVWLQCYICAYLCEVANEN